MVDTIREKAGVSSVRVECLVKCPVCGGDGKETCDNPDHGFIGAIGGEIRRLGCPVCGHDENFKVPGGGDCFECNGVGKVSAGQAAEYLESI